MMFRTVRDVFTTFLALPRQCRSVMLKAVYERYLCRRQCTPLRMCGGDSTVCCSTVRTAHDAQAYGRCPHRILRRFSGFSEERCPYPRSFRPL
eukprot:scaffold27350_cov38-Tisochrysis_lutea.AAC.2